MISIRMSEKEIIVIQNNKQMYNLLKSTYLSFFIITGFFNILKNNIKMLYINGVIFLILYFLSIKLSKVKKKVFIKLNNKELKIYNKNYILDNIVKIIIQKEIYSAIKFCYILKLKLINEEEDFLLKSLSWKELNQVKKLILKYKKKGKKNEMCEKYSN